MTAPMPASGKPNLIDIGKVKWDSSADARRVYGSAPALMPRPLEGRNMSKKSIPAEATPKEQSFSGGAL